MRAGAREGEGEGRARELFCGKGERFLALRGALALPSPATLHTPLAHALALALALFVASGRSRPETKHASVLARTAT
jgi:hypothetical protein